MTFLHEQLTLMVTQFHWLRPWWLLAFIPMLALSILLWRQKHQAHQWQQLIAPELLPFLLDGKTITTKKSLLWGLILAWFISTIALAGPSWIKRPTPVEKNQNALVILLDLSISMFSEDVKPSRIVRARLKIADILRERKDGQTALVVYAGEAHTVTPLSDDSATIVSLLPALLPNIMPLQGSNTEAAIARGIQLLHDAGATQGDLLLITDGVVPEAFPKIKELLSNKKIHLNILGVGTNQPAPIASGNGGFLRDKQGAIITTQLNSSELNTLAQQVHGRYSDIANTNSDINALLPHEEKADNNKPTLERDFDQWFDQGHWLVFLLLPIVLLSFRRGFILLLICIPLLGLTPKSAYAADLQEMWLTKDQQAQNTLSAGDAKKAAELFENPEWKAAAQYRAGDYVAAAENFAKNDSASAHYNRGNALAKSGKLEDAIKAYDEALKRDANLEDAKKNRALVEKALKQQKEQDKQKKDQKDSDKKDQDKDKQDQDKQDQEKQDQKDSKDSKDSKDQKQDDKKSQEEKDKQQQDKKDQQGEQDKQQNQNSSAQDSQQQGQASSAAQQSAAAQGGASSAATSGDSRQMAQASSQAQDDKKADQKQQQATLDQNNLTEEQKQALEQWLRRVPDDPGGLLRNKFKYQYLQNRQKKADGEFESPKNNADQRW